MICQLKFTKIEQHFLKTSNHSQWMAVSQKTYQHKQNRVKDEKNSMWLRKNKLSALKIKHSLSAFRICCDNDVGDYNTTQCVPIKKFKKPRTFVFGGY